MSTTATLLVDPPLLLPWLSSYDRKHRLILVDVDVDFLEDRDVRIDIQVVFNSLRLRRGLLQPADWYVGCTGAEIEFDSPDGRVTGYTPDHVIQVNYTNELAWKRSSRVQIKPSVRVKTGTAGSEAPLGEICLDVGADRKYTTAFSATERALAAIPLGKGLRWSIDMPRGEKIVRDFLLGTLHLWLTACWDKRRRRWYIAARPADVRFFDSQKRPVGKYGSLVMRYMLHRAGIVFSELLGVTLAFEEVSSDG